MSEREVCVCFSFPNQPRWPQMLKHHLEHLMKRYSRSHAMDAQCHIVSQRPFSVTQQAPRDPSSLVQDVCHEQSLPFLKVYFT